MGETIAKAPAALLKQLLGAKRPLGLWAQPEESGFKHKCTTVAITTLFSSFSAACKSSAPPSTLVPVLGKASSSSEVERELSLVPSHHKSPQIRAQPFFQPGFLGGVWAAGHSLSLQLCHPTCSKLSKGWEEKQRSQKTQRTCYQTKILNNLNHT